MMEVERHAPVQACPLSRTVPEGDPGKVNNSAGNERAKLALFEELILPHLDAAHNLARWLTGDADDAQEVVQEAYLRAFRYFDSYNGGDSKSWLLTIVRNTAFTWRSSRRQEPAAESFDESNHSSGSAAQSPEERLVNAANAAILRSCIEALPLEFREVLIMRELEEMSYRQISEVVCIPVGTVMSRLSRARKRLAECARGAAARSGK